MGAFDADDDATAVALLDVEALFVVVVEFVDVELLDGDDGTAAAVGFIGGFAL